MAFEKILIRVPFKKAPFENVQSNILNKNNNFSTFENNYESNKGSTYNVHPLKNVQNDILTKIVI
jgi:hypothetical protein